MLKTMENINQYLLPYRFKRLGYYLIIAGIPLVLAIFTLLVFQVDSSAFKVYWDEFGGYFLHLPLSLGLFWILFSTEKGEDEMFLQLRLKATFHGIRFIFIAILFLPVFGLFNNLISEAPVSLPDIGGNLAVVTLLLAYANGAYWYFKRKLEKNEE